MKNIRILALVTVAAAVSLATVAAPSAVASETTLCKSSANLPNCEAADRYAANTQIEAKLVGAVTWENEIMPVTCHVSKLKAETTAVSGEPLAASVSSLTFSTCSFGCTVTVKGMPHSASITQTESGNGKLDYTSGSPNVDLYCYGMFEHCEYPMPSMTVSGGAEPQLSWEKAALKPVSQVGCPPSMEVSKATYAVSTPKPAYVGLVTPLHTRLCKVSENPCSIANSYPSGTAIEAESTNLKVAYDASAFTCKTATLTANTASLAGEPLPLSGVKFTGTGCNNAGFGSCTLTSNEASGSILAEGGKYYLRTPSSTLTFACGTLNCALSLVEVPGLMTSTSGETPAKLEYVEVPGSMKGSACPSYVTLTATFTVKAPKPLYFA